MGWPPMNRGSATASTIDALTLPTSVTVPSVVASASLAASATARTGVARKVISASGSRADRVERAELERPRRDRRIAVVPGDVPAPAPQRQPDRAADQPGADHRRLVRSRHAHPGRSSRRPTAPSRYTWRRSARLRSVVRCISTRMQRGVPPSTSSSRAQISGTSPRPILRAPVAGKVAWRSSVAVKRMLTMSS